MSLLLTIIINTYNVVKTDRILSSFLKSNIISNHLFMSNLLSCDKSFLVKRIQYTLSIADMYYRRHLYIAGTFFENDNEYENEKIRMIS